MKTIVDEVKKFVGVHMMRLGLKLMGHDVRATPEIITQDVNPTNDPDIETDTPVQVSMSRKALEQIQWRDAPKPPTNTPPNGHKRGSVASRMKQ